MIGIKNGSSMERIYEGVYLLSKVQKSYGMIFYYFWVVRPMNGKKNKEGGKGLYGKAIKLLIYLKNTSF